VVARSASQRESRRGPISAWKLGRRDLGDLSSLAEASRGGAGVAREHRAPLRGLGRRSRARRSARNFRPRNLQPKVVELESHGGRATCQQGARSGPVRPIGRRRSALSFAPSSPHPNPQPTAADAGGPRKWSRHAHQAQSPPVDLLEEIAAFPRTTSAHELLDNREGAPLEHEPWLRARRADRGRALSRKLPTDARLVLATVLPSAKRAVALCGDPLICLSRAWLTVRGTLLNSALSPSCVTWRRSHERRRSTPRRRGQPRRERGANKALTPLLRGRSLEPKGLQLTKGIHFIGAPTPPKSLPNPATWLIRCRAATEKQAAKKPFLDPIRPAACGRSCVMFGNEPNRFRTPDDYPRRSRRGRTCCTARRRGRRSFRASPGAMERWLSRGGRVLPVPRSTKTGKRPSDMLAQRRIHIFAKRQ